MLLTSPPAGLSRLVGADLVHRLEEVVDIPVRYLPPEGVAVDEGG